MKDIFWTWLNGNLGVAMVSAFLSIGVLWTCIKSSRRSG